MNNRQDNRIAAPDSKRITRYEAGLFLMDDILEASKDDIYEKCVFDHCEFVGIGPVLFSDCVFYGMVDLSRLKSETPCFFEDSLFCSDTTETTE